MHSRQVSWFWQLLSNSTITRTAVLDAFGPSRHAACVYTRGRCYSCKTALLWQLRLFTGAQQQKCDLPGFASRQATSCKGFETSYGSSSSVAYDMLRIKRLQHRQILLVRVTVGTNVNIQFSHQCCFHTCNLDFVDTARTCPALFSYSNPNPGLANNGTLTATFPTPGTVGTYTAYVYGYDEQTLDLSVEDTMHFQVSSLTGIKVGGK